VAELSPQDLRRLRTLEERLEKAADEKRSFTIERRELRARATAAERAAKAAEKRAAGLDDQLAAVLTENAGLATRLDEIAADSERLRAAGVKLREELDAAKKSLREGVAEARRLTKTLERAEADRERLAEHLKVAEAQLKAKTTTPVLPAKEVAKLIDGFIEEIGTGLPGLSVREGEIRLQVAFGKAGRASGFVVPSADPPAEVRTNLHELSFRFDRTLGVEPEG
jgi:chromosome segregation ATPase